MAKDKDKSTPTPPPVVTADGLPDSSIPPIPEDPSLDPIPPITDDGPLNTELTLEPPILKDGERGAKPGDEIEVLKARYGVLEKTRQDLLFQRSQIENQLRAVEQEINSVLPLISTPQDPQDNQRGIMTYIEHQNQARHARVISRNEILKGLTLAEALPPKGSNLDQAMAHKRGFGMKRPGYPAKT